MGTLDVVAERIRKEVHGAILGLCHKAGRGVESVDGLLFEALADALPDFDPARGSLAARVVWHAACILRGEMPQAFVSLDEEGEDGHPLRQFSGGGDPAAILQLLEDAAADPLLLARQLGACGSREVANASGISRRQAQRRAKAARERAAGPQNDFFGGVGV